MTHVPRLLCCTCGQEMLIHKTGAMVQVNAGHGPYYKISTDAYACPECGTVVAYCSPRTEPVIHHFEPGFSEKYPPDYVAKLHN